jgi:hypothetical protein
MEARSSAHHLVHELDGFGGKVPLILHYALAAPVSRFKFAHAHSRVLCRPAMRDIHIRLEVEEHEQVHRPIEAILETIFHLEAMQYALTCPHQAR